MGGEIPAEPVLYCSTAINLEFKRWVQIIWYDRFNNCFTIMLECLVQRVCKSPKHFQEALSLKTARLYIVRHLAPLLSYSSTMLWTSIGSTSVTTQAAALSKSNTCLLSIQSGFSRPYFWCYQAQPQHFRDCLTASVVWLKESWFKKKIQSTLDSRPYFQCP